MIRISPIRVIGHDNAQIGVIETIEALRIAEEQGLDLVEVAPDSRPPVCKIMDYGKYKYDQAKRQRKNRAASKAAEMKQIRLGRSVKIDNHDVGIRVNQARKFLITGHKVQITQRFRGREIVHKDLGLERLQKIAVDLANVSKLESPPRWAGRQASIVLAPDTAKIREYLKEQERLSKDNDSAPEDDEVELAEPLDELDDDLEEGDNSESNENDSENTASENDSDET